MSETIYVVIDHTNGEIRNASWETLVLGQRMAAQSGFELHALILGDDPGPVAEQVGRKQLDSVIAVADPKLRSYEPDSHCAALSQVLAEDAPHILLMAHIYQNIDLAPKLAAAIGTGLLTDCIDYRWEGGGFTFVRQVFRNKIDAEIRIRSRHPWLVTVQSGAFNSDDLEDGSAPPASRVVDLASVQVRRESLETIEGMKGGVDLTKADIIVGVGRGIKKEENLQLIHDLAEALGAEIGASRPVVDNGWLERERQIGSSGQNVQPKLYVACGISGAIQHIVGMKGAQCIVAINSDPNAPIFNIANYGIVGDLLEIAPVLTRKIRELKS